MRVRQKEILCLFHVHGTTCGLKKKHSPVVDETNLTSTISRELQP